MLTEKQLLRDENIEPTGEVIAEGLGFANDVYVGFLEKLGKHDIELTWRYYNDGKAWLGKGCINGQPSGEPKKKRLPFGSLFGKVFSR